MLIMLKLIHREHYQYKKASALDEASHQWSVAFSYHFVYFFLVVSLIIEHCTHRP